MSATDWTSCPRCRLRLENAAAALKAEADAAYGKVPVEEYLALRQQAEKAQDAPAAMDDTFRENYEIHGADTGCVKVGYSGGCTECGLSLTFEHEVHIEGIAA